LFCFGGAVEGRAGGDIEQEGKKDIKRRVVDKEVVTKRDNKNAAKKTKKLVLAYWTLALKKKQNRGGILVCTD
jgi:hypothetical protein